MQFGFNWLRGFREYYDYIHVYSPVAGADNPLGQFFFHKHKYSSHLLISSKFSTDTRHFPFFSPFKCLGDLSWPCCKIGQGHPKVYKICRAPYPDASCQVSKS